MNKNLSFFYMNMKNVILISKYLTIKRIITDFKKMISTTEFCYSGMI
jgi:hypothetical protein